MPRNIRNLTAHLPSPCYSAKKASHAVNAARNIVKGYINRERQYSAAGEGLAVTLATNCALLTASISLAVSHPSAGDERRAVRLPNVGTSGTAGDDAPLPPRAPPPRPRSSGGDKENAVRLERQPWMVHMSPLCPAHLNLCVRSCLQQPRRQLPPSHAAGMPPPAASKPPPKPPLSRYTQERQKLRADG